MQAHVAGQPLMNPKQLNPMELSWMWPASAEWRVRVGSTGLKDIVAVGGMGERELLRIFQDEHHVCVLAPSGVLAVMAEGAPPQALLRMMWQAQWLLNQQSRANGNGIKNSTDLLQNSVDALKGRFEGFLSEARAAGWDVGDVRRLSAGSVRYRLE